ALPACSWRAVCAARGLVGRGDDGDAETLAAARRAGQNLAVREVVDQIAAPNLVLADAEPSAVRQPQRLRRVVVDEQVRAAARGLCPLGARVGETRGVAFEASDCELAFAEREFRALRLEQRGLDRDADVARELPLAAGIEARRRRSVGLQRQRS